MRISASTVARLRLEEGKAEQRFFDDALAGFGVRVRTGGKRTFIAQYRGTDGKSKTLTIGPVEKLTADEARKRAREALAGAVLGNDPAELKADARAQAALTLGAVVNLYLADDGPARARLQASSYRDVARYLRSTWEPLHSLPLRKISRHLVSARVTEVAISTGARSANCARDALSSVFGWCMRRGIADANPVIGSEKAVEAPPRDRVLSDDEIVAVWRAADDIGYPFGRAVQMLILTGQRRSEVIEAAWSEFDLERATWSLPKERSKTGVAHLVPLAPAAIDLLEPLPRGKLVFTTTGATPFSGVSKSVDRLNKLAANHTPDQQPLPAWRIHDIRRSFASGCARLGVPVHVVEKALNHTSGTFGGIVGVYQRHEFHEERRRAMELWAEHVMGLVHGEPKVVAFPQRGA